MKPFPDIWYRGNVAMFYVGKHLVVVPLKFGSSDRAEHFIPLLYRLWEEHPFTVRGGRLVQRYTKQIDGVRKDVEGDVAHKLFAAHAHRDIGFEWSEVTAKNGNFLFLSAENIVPVRNPDAPATANEKEHAAQRHMQEHISDGTFNFMLKFFAQFLREQEKTDVISTKQLTELQTASVQTILTAERILAKDMTRDDVEQQNFFERWLFNMTRPDLVIEKRPDNHPDGVAHPRPKTSTKSIGWHDENDEDTHTVMLQGRKGLSVDAMVRSRVARGNRDAAKEEARHIIKNVRTENDKYVPFTDHILQIRRAGLQGCWNDPSTEAVLKRHGWRTPANGGKPRYEGKGFNGVGN
jgi:hypothetical protein